MNYSARDIVKLVAEAAPLGIPLAWDYIKSRDLFDLGMHILSNPQMSDDRKISMLESLEQYKTFNVGRGFEGVLTSKAKGGWKDVLESLKKSKNEPPSESVYVEIKEKPKAFYIN